MRLVRVVIALAAFCGVNLFFLGLANTSFGVARMQLLPALLAGNALAAAAVAAATLAFGRVYCSTVCPLGTLQDVAFRLRRAVSGRKLRLGFAPPLNGLKIACLAAAAAAVAFGCAAFAGLLDGYAWYGRIAAFLFRPLAQHASNAASDFLAARGVYTVFRQEIAVAGVGACVSAGLFLAGIFALAAARGRAFCNTVCPTGTILALLARKSAMQIAFSEKDCVKCGICAALCKSRCIDVKNAKVDQARCVRCFDCIGACPKSALSYSPAFCKKTPSAR